MGNTTVDIRGDGDGFMAVNFGIGWTKNCCEDGDNKFGMHVYFKNFKTLQKWLFGELIIFSYAASLSSLEFIFDEYKILLIMNYGE